MYSSSKEMVHPDQQASFQTNGVGIAFSHWFGFGVVDGEKGFEVLKQWQSYDVNSLQSVDSGEIRVDRVITTPVTVGDNDGDYTESEWVNNQGDNKATKWVEVTVVISHQRRGDVQVELLSPSGTLSVLAHPRPNDSGRNFNYKFTTVANWDENVIVFFLFFSVCFTQILNAKKLAKRKMEIESQRYSIVAGKWRKNCLMAN